MSTDAPPSTTAAGSTEDGATAAQKPLPHPEAIGGQPIDQQQFLHQQQQRLLFQQQQEQLRYVYAQQQNQRGAAPPPPGGLPPGYNQLYVQGVPAMPAAPSYGQPSPGRYAAGVVAAAAVGGAPPHLYVPPHLIAPYHQQQQAAALAAYQQQQAAQQQQQQQQQTADLSAKPAGGPPTPQQVLKTGRVSGTPQPPSFATPNESVVASGLPAPSPSAASSVHDETSIDGSKCHSLSTAFQPPTPSSSRANTVPVASVSSSGQPSTSSSAAVGDRASLAECVEKLVVACGVNVPPQLLAPRRAFFEHIVQLQAEKGEMLSAPPQVSKSVIDLYALYEAVRRRGGFQQVTRDKCWKQLCPEANPIMQESSAAGYQLRRHYQHYLLGLECRETGRNAEELVEFAERQKKKKKERDAPAATHHQSPIRTPDAAARHTPGAPAVSSAGATPRQTQTPAGVGFHALGMQPGMTPDGSHPSGPSPADYNSAAAAAAAAASSAYYAAYGHHPQHAAAAAWAAQHGYLPGASGAYNSAMRAVLPPGMRSMSDLNEEQQRQYYQHQQQQAAYAAHIQQQQILAAAAQQQKQQQQQIQQQQQQNSSSLQIPPADGTQGAASTPSARPGGATDSRAPSTGVPDGRPPSQRPPSTAPRHTPTPAAYPYAASANAPTPPLTISTQMTSQQPQQQQQATPQSQPRATPQPTPQLQSAVVSSAVTSSSTAAVSTVTGPSPYFPPGGAAAPSLYNMRQLPPGVRPPAAMMMYGSGAVAPGGGEIPPGVYPPGMYPPQQMWARYNPADYTVFQQQQIRNQQAAFHQQQQQTAQQQQYAAAEAQRRAATGFYVPPGSAAAPPSVATAAAAGATAVPAASHSPGSIQRTRIAALTQQQTPATQQQQQMAARTAAAGVMPPGYGAHHAAAVAHAAQMNAAVAAQMVAAQIAAAQMAPSTSGLNFPAGCIEALTANGSVMKRRRPKMLMRDLTHTTPKRLLMALRSGQHIETSWAINALNIMLYDDTQPTLSLSGTPELLNAVVEHLVAALSILFPKHFTTTQSDERLRLADDGEEGSRQRSDGFEYVLDAELTTTTAPNAITVPIATSKSARRGSGASKAQTARARKELRNDDTISEPLVTIIADANAAVRAVVRPPMGYRSGGPKSAGGSVSANYTRVSRTGRRVFQREAPFPVNLVKLLPAGTSVDQQPSVKSDSRDEKIAAKLDLNRFGSYLSNRLRGSLLAWMEADLTIASHRPQFSAALNTDQPLGFWLPETFDLLFPDKKTDNKIETKPADTAKQEEPDSTVPDENNFFRRAGKTKYLHDDVPSNCALVMRPPMLQDVDPLMQQVADRCLALSNILRGFSFQPGQERTLCQHVGLLRLIAVQLRLLADEEEFMAGVEKPKSTEAANDKPEAEDHKVELPSRTRENTAVPSRIVAARRLLIETANHLRDDAFTILAHISVQLDLFDVDDEVSWMIFDALLNWAVSNSIQARDPILPGVISPRSYTLEILCKMSVIERNVDLLLSTGSWPRLAEFVRFLCGLINLEEELPYREFAIVILNAICAASESACHVAAMETPVLNNLVFFLELADSKMHQIVQQQGMPALRENPELMGTSVGMLRRATLIMLHIARLEQCRTKFSQLQCRLLTFTTSHFMDSRVAAMVADILFEMQRSENNKIELTFSPPLSSAAVDAAPTVQKEAAITIEDSSLNDGQPKEAVQTNEKIAGKDDDLFKDPTAALKRPALARHAHVNGGDAADVGSRKRPISPKCRDENDVHLSTKKIASDLVMEKLRSNIIHKHGDDQNSTSVLALKKTKLLNGSTHKFLAKNHEDGNHEPAKMNGQRNNNNNNGKPAGNNNNNKAGSEPTTITSPGQTELDPATDTKAAAVPTQSAAAVSAAVSSAAPSAQSGSMTAVA